eukprot:3721245-Rhodomonas_salina.1
MFLLIEMGGAEDCLLTLVSSVEEKEEGSSSKSCHHDDISSVFQEGCKTDLGLRGILFSIVLSCLVAGADGVGHEHECAGRPRHSSPDQGR